MSKKTDRRLVTCEQCERTYPGLQSDDGGLHVVGGPACPSYGAAALVEVEGAALEDST
jgi:hypothetical protein